MTYDSLVKTRRNSRIGWTPLVLALALAAPSTLTAQLSLATVVDLAQRKSDTVRLAEADMKKAEAALAQTVDVFVPSVGFSSGLPAFPSIGFSGNPPSIFSANLQSMVVSFSQKHYVQGARAGLQAASLNLKEAREQVALDASIAYIELDTVNRLLEASRRQESFSARLVEIERERTEAGVDPLNDLLQAELTVAQLKLKRLHLETRAATLTKQLADLTALPAGSIATDRATIPEVPQVRATDQPHTLPGIESARMVARSRRWTAQGDTEVSFLPQIGFSAQYNRDTKLWNNADSYFAHPLKSDNLSSGFSVQIPLFDLGLHAKAKQSSAEALRATVEAEQAQRQNEVQIATLTGSLRELDTLAEIANLKREIAVEQVKSVEAQLELGNGSGSGPGSQPQLSPKAEQLARIDESQKEQEALDAGLELSKTRLGLLRALGHMEDWLREVHTK